MEEKSRYSYHLPVNCLFPTAITNTKLCAGKSPDASSDPDTDDLTVEHAFFEHEIWP